MVKQTFQELKNRTFSFTIFVQNVGFAFIITYDSTHKPRIVIIK